MLEIIISAILGAGFGFMFACIFASNSVRWDDYEAAITEVKRLRSELADETAKKEFYKKAYGSKI